MNPTTVSLFCGAGGESAGKEMAFRDLGIDTIDYQKHAINHWDLAVATHGANFPGIHVHQEDITQCTAATFGVTQIDMLWASPSCVHHSRARGGKPKSDQERSHADEVVERWLKVANVDVLLIENVPEFADWGPLYRDHNQPCDPDAPRCLKGCHYDQPIPEKKGQFFQRFLMTLKKLGYRTEWRVLCAADYGDPTIRKRFFMQAIKDGRPIAWPEASHRDPKKGADLFTGHLPLWRTAAECIDWTIPCPSIFDRKKPLADATLARIAEGIRRYVLETKRPFLVDLTHGVRLESVDEAFKTITGAHGGEKALVVPSLVGVGGRAGQSAPRTVEDPMATGTAKADTAVVAAFLAKHYGGGPNGNPAPSQEMTRPVPTVTATGQLGLVAASITKFQENSIGSQMDEPLHTVMAGAPRFGVLAASIVGIDNANGKGVWPADEPLTTATSKARHCLMAASMIQTGFGEREGQAPRCLNIEAPLGTVVAGGSKHALVAAFIQQYYSTGGQHQSIADPLHAVTTIARHSLVTVDINGETYAIVDIGMRMLEPKELAKAMGFPDDYKWAGLAGGTLTKRDQIKMIGNACPVNTVAALIKSVVLGRPNTYKQKEVA